uniref:Reverse transcriptase domain-containing protein n=1 Tax=Graphocephala atropunctata TaxID=36148 RepID=A0A1B6LSV4_9HEMI
MAEYPIKCSSPSEILHFIKSFKLKKSPGHDKTPNSVLQNLPTKGLTFLAPVFNTCLNLYYFPQTWKHSVIITIPKPGKPSHLSSSYHPISILPTLSKLFEKIIKKRLQSHLDESNVVPPHQFGFRSHHSSIHQLLRVSEDINKTFEKKKHTVALFMDVTQAGVPRRGEVWRSERHQNKFWEGFLKLNLM